jgi:aspartate carbamoyltransferase catalytic subunit
MAEIEQVPHILSAKQFDTDQLGDLFERTDFMADKMRNSEPIDCPRRLGRNAVATVFYEPSTRTRLSFEAAAQYLGLPILSTENAGEFSSAVKGESVEDTVHTIGRYAANGAIVMRHKEEGALEHAAAAGSEIGVPIINAGDGEGEHPTQGQLDLYTIKKELGTTEGLNVVIGGDLVKGRTARSLAILLSLYKDNHVTFVSLPELRIGDDIKHHLAETGTSYEETEDMYTALKDADVVYWTRLQLERHDDEEKGKEGICLERNYVIDQAAIQTMEDDAILLHPLPRNNEISRSVDHTRQAKYFNQVENGLYVRMALLDKLLRAADE